MNVITCRQCGRQEKENLYNGSYWKEINYQDRTGICSVCIYEGK